MDLAAIFSHDPARHTPAAIPFSQNLRLTHFKFRGGLAAAYHIAPGGASGKVIVGELAGDPDDGTPIAIKVMPSDGVSREEALEERNLLLRLRLAADAARTLEAAGAPLLPAERGAQHVAYLYGMGHEPSLQALDATLPAVDAFLIALEPLEQTLKTFLLHTPPAEVDTLLRIARDLALALAFSEQQRVVVRCFGQHPLLSAFLVETCISGNYLVRPPYRSTRTSRPTMSCSRQTAALSSVTWASGGCI